MPQLKEEFINTGRVRFIYRPYVFAENMENPVVRQSAEALFCAAEQGKYYELNDWIYANVDEWAQAGDAVAILSGKASTELGLDGSALGACMQSEKYRPQLEAIASDAEARQIFGTPTFVVNDQKTLTVESGIELLDFRQAITGGAETPAAVKIGLALVLPALLGLFLIGNGPTVSAKALRLRMILGVLSVLGLVVSLALSLLELNVTAAIPCPSGDGCGVVNQSRYVNMFGVPIAIIGIFGYGVILAILLAKMTRRNVLGIPVAGVLTALSGFGVAFSLFLAGLEIFAIHNWCFWCMVSGVLMVAILVLSIVGWLQEREPARVKKAGPKPAAV